MALPRIRLDGEVEDFAPIAAQAQRAGTSPTFVSVLRTPVATGFAVVPALTGLWICARNRHSNGRVCGIYFVNTQSLEGSMKTKLVKIGNSRGIRIPKSMIEEAGIEEVVDLN